MTNRWRETYETRLTTAEAALAGLKSGDRVFVGTAAGEPQHLVKALAARSMDLADVELMQFHTLGDGFYTAEAYKNRLRVNSLFVSDSIREAVGECRADYTPVFLSQLPRLFRSGQIPLDTALIMTTPPDEHGFLSLGVSVDITRGAVDNARVVIAQVNPKMPRTFGGALVHVSEVTHLVEHEEDLLTYPAPEPGEVHRRIAQHISRLVGDGATIQVGAGRLPNAVIPFLTDKNDLGIHTELFSDGLMELAKSGVITGRRKKFHPGKIVASLAMGTPELYEYMDGNPMLELHPSDYVNSPVNVAQNPRIVAINSGLEVDLTGQVCAESIGYRFYSGMGGHADFIRGAAMAEDGKPIIALPSVAQTPDGPVSRITPALNEGAGVLTTRGDIHYVATEHGVAYLQGKTMRERAMALIAVAHPDFRQDLLHAAKARRLVFAHQIIPPRGAVYPEELETKKELEDGSKVTIRPVKTTDDELIKDLFYSFSEKTVYLRFHAVVKEMPHSRRQVFCNVDYNLEMALVAEIEVEDRTEFIGVGRYLADPGTKTAELAFVVRDEFQGKGLGRALFGRLAEIAKAKGITKFTAEVLVENKAMLHVFRAGGYPMKTSREAGVVHVELDISGREEE